MDYDQSDRLLREIWKFIHVHKLDIGDRDTKYQK